MTGNVALAGLFAASHAARRCLENAARSV